MRHPIVPHHPVHHGPVHHGGGAAGGHQNPHHRGGRGGPPHKKPRPPSKAHKKPKPAKKPKKPVPKKPVRKWSPGWDVDCCSAQALGTLLGWDWLDVLRLYGRTGGAATIGDTLEAYRQIDKRGNQDYQQDAFNDAVGKEQFPAPGPHGLILGVTLPEPHALAVTRDGRWWSWGEPFEPGDWPDLIIDETWAVLLCPR